MFAESLLRKILKSRFLKKNMKEPKQVRFVAFQPEDSESTERSSSKTEEGSNA